MAGYLQDPLQIINLIADNLRDRYESGFPVLKEIIQNVDDAGKDCEKLHLEFGYCGGLPQATHQLLKGPALYFLNNGNFTDSDNRAIRSFGLNQKAAEQSAIGKFGLGMKSVFHFCEAFFYLAKNSEKNYEVILNPWSGDDEFSSFHRDWDNFDANDAEFVREQLGDALSTATKLNDSFMMMILLSDCRLSFPCSGGLYPYVSAIMILSLYLSWSLISDQNVWDLRFKKAVSRNLKGLLHTRNLRRIKDFHCTMQDVKFGRKRMN